MAEAVSAPGDALSALVVIAMHIAEAIFPISSAVAPLDITEGIGAPDGARVHQGQRR